MSDPQERLAEALRASVKETRRLREQNRRLVAASLEPVAVVGIGCRFPGGVTGPEDLWDLLADGADVISGMPVDRGWDLENLYDPDPDHPGTSYVRQGGFVRDAADFDAEFFGISPREALAMDPQQRLLLEVAWEALERAGIAPGSLRGAPTGVFVGATPTGYGQELEGLEGHLLTGMAPSVMSGRVSYLLGLEGPAVTVDTACSSSLVALHLACRALRSGECTMALAGGVTVMASPSEFVGFSQQRGLAKDGRCKAFSADADGMGLSEGAGMIVLMRLSDARRGGHPVLAVVEGTAINQDGASNGLTAPNGLSQQRVIRSALAEAGLSADQVDAVEAHGTGTTLGDPIEAQALIATYGQDRADGRPLWLGSVKSNIGHSQLAAGVAGVIKLVLALRHQTLPATLHADEPSPHVNWEAGAVRLLAEPVPWPAGDRVRRAGVSSFGFSGTNAHMIVAEPPAPDGALDAAPGAGAGAAPARGEGERPPAPVLTASTVAWLVSSRSAEGLRAQAARLAAHVAARPALDPADVGWSLATTRSVFEHRAVVLGASLDELAVGLAAVTAGEPAPGTVSGEVPAGGAGRVVFVFPGQGGQWAGMGRELAACCPVFAERLAECSRALAPHTGWDLERVLAGAEGAPGLEATDVVQPALWAVMVSLAAVWQAAGVTPDAVVGHSQGEIAAATVAGILSVEDAAAVVALRSRALLALAGRGGMASVAEPADQVRQRLGAWGERLAVAAVNGPSATVVSGEPAALAELVAACESEGVRARTVPVDYASHCAQVEAIREEVLAALAGVTLGPAAIPMVSAMTGQWLDGPEAGAGYWYDSLRAPVEFDRAVRVLAASGHGAFAEISPHPVLTAAITQTLEDAAGAAGGEGTAGESGAIVEAGAVGAPAPVVTGTLRRDEGGPARLLASLAEAHVHGAPVDWAAVLGGGRRVELPTYAFQRRRFWPRPTAPAPADGGPVSAAEARFWAAVEDENARELAAVLAVDEGRLGEAVPALASWRRRERTESATEGWRYRVAWQPVAEPGAAALTGRWLVVVPAGVPGMRGVSGAAGGEPARGCVRALADRGAETTVIRTGAGTGRRELAAVIGALAGADDGPGAGIGGVLSLLALDEEPVPGWETVAAGLAGTLDLVQALGDAEVTAPLWVLTRGAVVAEPGEEVASLAQAMVWGLGRVAGLEHPGRWGGLVDLPPSWNERVGARLAAVLAGCGEDQVAIRPGGTLARRLLRAAPDPAPARSWTPRGTVLVTGGTGAIAPYLAVWLARRGAARVVLTGRGGPLTAGVAEAAARVAAAGAEVAVVACDLSVRDDVRALLDWIETSGPALSAVMHAAARIELEALEDAGIDDLAAALAGKVTGADILDELTAGMNLDAFVMFSSIAAVWASAYHGAYAAANAYLDALASDRRSRGLPATSVAWGTWDTGADRGQGVVPDSVSPVNLRRQGLGFLDPEQALAALGRVLAQDETSMVLADVDWSRFAPVYRAARCWPLLEQIAEVQALAEAPAERGEGDARLARQLAGLPDTERDRVLTDLIRGHASAVLGYASADAIDPGRAFRDMGFDSLIAVELRDRLNTATGLRLPSTVVFDYPSAAALARQVARLLLGGAEAPSAAPVVAVADEPVAVVAMSCRYPGGVTSPEELWELLAAGTDAISELPADRGWDIERLYDPDPEHPGTSYTRHGGFLAAAGGFDAGFFGISPREALAMDPQQRLLLEVCWEAIERAGIDPLTLRGSATGVFAGASGSQYGTEMDSPSGHEMIGNATSAISGRVSYVLGLEGPAVTVDTACSSSLTALHLASQALRRGECDLALAGGVAVMAGAGEFVGFSRQRALAPDGRCKAFGAGADGMGLAEGVGMVLLERLSDARAAGHPVLAVVRSTALNQDGASNGLTAPNGPSQQRVIRTALAGGGLSPDEVDVVEAHGTGTKLGDPIEAQALIATYGQDRPASRPLLLGSVKSNIGHAQAAAGVAGVIKMVLALQHGMLPATLHADELSPHVDWSAGSVRVVTQAVPWQANGHPRRAGISAFGISGTNAHAIIEEPPAVVQGDAGGQVSIAGQDGMAVGGVAAGTRGARADRDAGLAGVGADRGEPGGAGRAAGGACGRAAGAGPGRPGRVAGDDPVGLRTPGGDHRRGPGGTGGGAGRARGRPALGEGDQRCRPGGRAGSGRVRVRRAGLSAGRDGRGAACRVPGVRGGLRRGVRAAGGPAGAAGGRCGAGPGLVRGRSGRPGRPDRVRAGRAVRGGSGPGGAAGRVRDQTRCGGRPLGRGDRGGARGRGPDAGRRVHAGGGAGTADAGAARRRGDDRDRGH